MAYVQSYSVARDGVKIHLQGWGFDVSWYPTMCPSLSRRGDDFAERSQVPQKERGTTDAVYLLCFISDHSPITISTDIALAPENAKRLAGRASAVRSAQDVL